MTNDGSSTEREVGRIRDASGADEGGGGGGSEGSGGGERQFEEDAFGMKDEYGDLRNIFAAQVSDEDDLHSMGRKVPVGYLRVRPVRS